MRQDWVIAYLAPPLTRGWTRSYKIGPDKSSGFPAHAGMDPNSSPSSTTSSRRPRSRGDGPAGSYVIATICDELRCGQLARLHRRKPRFSSPSRGRASLSPLATHLRNRFAFSPWRGAFADETNTLLTKLLQGAPLIHWDTVETALPLSLKVLAP